MSKMLTDDSLCIYLDGLQVKVRHSDEKVLSDAHCEVRPGEILGLAGETGSGKTTLALAMLGYASPGLYISKGSIIISSRKVLDLQAGVQLSKSEWRALRGNEVSYVPQDPGGALPPSMTVREGFASVMRAHGIRAKAEHQGRMESLFRTVGLSCEDSFLKRYPHQLSGGQQQRVAIAIAFAHSPKLVVMDEPTTGLDATTTRKVIGLIRDLSERFRASTVFVSHDLRLLLSLADRIAVLHNGVIVEGLSAEGFISQAAHPYTLELIKALPRADKPISPERLPPKLLAAGAAGTGAVGGGAALGGAVRGDAACEGAVGGSTACGDAAAAGATGGDGGYGSAAEQGDGGTDVLQVRGLTAAYGRRTVTQALDFSIERGSCLAFVGESGSGKTTTARCVAGIHSNYQGQVLIEGKMLPQALRKRSLEQRKSVQYVFQNPTAALNPRKMAGDSIVSAIRSFHGLGRKAAWGRAARLAEDVGLRPDHLQALPHQLSGGQKQRLCLARALAAEPSLLICDEVTSSLDVIVQSEIIDLLHRLQHERNLTLLFITHDFGLARVISSRTMVLFDGEVVESGATEQVISRPQNPYTQSLIESASLNERRN
jgi:peptide/nickel transport system ATP-binding protein